MAHTINSLLFCVHICLGTKNVISFLDRKESRLQGALDGGLDIPHGDKRFVGYDTEAKKLDPEQLKKYILGVHVSFTLLSATENVSKALFRHAL